MPNREFSTPNKDLVIPTPLKSGDLVGVVAASGPPSADLLNEGIRFLERRGFRVRTGRHVYEKNGYLAGTDDQRCQDLNAMLRDAEVRGIFFARGGYGVMRVLDRLDSEALVQDPKVLLGMSDVTALQLSLYSRLNLVTFSGPMIAGQVGVGLDPISEKSLIEAVTQSPEGRDLWPLESTIKVLRGGRAQGRLIGGCLSLVAALLGTPHAPNFTDCILFLEDIYEAPYRIDRMLTQLKLAGVLDKAAGLILGHFVGSDDEDLGEEAERILMELTAEEDIPILSGFPHGHVLPNLTIPHGVSVQLDTDQRMLKVRLDLDSTVGLG